MSTIPASQKSHFSSHLRVSVTLAPADEFKLVSTRTTKGREYPFMCRTITYTGGDSVLCRGWAINKDGSQGSIQREDYFKIIQLPKPIIACMLMVAVDPEAAREFAAR